MVSPTYSLERLINGSLREQLEACGPSGESVRGGFRLRMPPLATCLKLPRDRDIAKLLIVLLLRLNILA